MPGIFLKPLIVVCFLTSLAAEVSAGPGRLISSTPMAGAPSGTRAWRIRYETRDQNGRAVESTGMVVAAANSAETRDVVAWAHGTVGIVEACAPSLRDDAFTAIPKLQEMVSQGWVVAATDYPGLGTRGPHGYLVGLTAAHAVLDSVRAARAIPDAHAGSRFAIWGHSQGGHATLWAGAEARSYAPELQLLGMVAASPPTDLPAIIAGMDPTAKGLLTSYVVESWSKVYGVPLSTIVDKSSEGRIGRATQGCVGGKTGVDQLIRVFALRGEMGTVNLAGTSPWSDLLARNSVAVPRGDVPVMVVSAAADKVVADSVTRQFAADACLRGVSVTFVPIADGDHATTAIETSDQALGFLADRFAERRAKGCSGL